jgi:hypothetical protein
LLIGEVTGGNISVYNPVTGDFLGQLSDAHGNPIFIRGVWTLIFARRESGDQSPQLYFAAGDAFPPDYRPSFFGVIRLDDGDNEQTAPDAPPTWRFPTRTRSASQNP